MNYVNLLILITLIIVISLTLHQNWQIKQIEKRINKWQIKYREETQWTTQKFTQYGNAIIKHFS